MKPKKEPSPWSARRVLLAEDDLQMRRLLAVALRRDGHEVLEAENGVELLEMIGNLFLGAGDRPRVDVIISDVRMPGFSGMEVLAGYRRADRATPFILITAFGDEELHARAQSLGATAVFDKPFDVDELRAAVRRVTVPTRHAALHPPGSPRPEANPP